MIPSFLVFFSKIKLNVGAVDVFLKIRKYITKKTFPTFSKKNTKTKKSRFY